MRKVKLPVFASLYKFPHKTGDYILLKATCKKDNDLVLEFFRKKEQWEEKNQKASCIQVVLDRPYQHRTYKQLNSVWILVTAIFESMEGRLPDEEEKYGLYLDLLEEYADKVPSRLNGKLRPVRISAANSMEGARFIDGLIYHLARYCDLTYDAQATVMGVLLEWHDWRGGLEIDPVDYADLECTNLLTESELREKHPVSEASGKGGDIELAHIVSRGSDAADIGMAWNWLALLHEEHMEQHRIGWDKFLTIYPHLRGRVDSARKLAKKMDLDFKREQQNVTHTAESLAMEAFNG